MIVFLDFDGVLRSASAPRYRFEKRCLRAFEQAVRSLPDLEIVVTSSWREVMSLTEIKKHFSEDIAARIVGVTPFSWERGDHWRHDEVLQFLREHRLEHRRWVAIDDDLLHYPTGSPLILTDPKQSFDEEAGRKMVESLIGTPRPMPR